MRVSTIIVTRMRLMVVEKGESSVAQEDLTLFVSVN
jgi:hypothetical protein